jgi:4-hydroxy-3-polyprenylbenzoate decarboxylase
LVLLFRETPLHLGHLEILQKIALLGGIILPPTPGFYHKPKSLDDIVNHSVGKALDLLGIELDLFPRWEGAS